MTTENNTENLVLEHLRTIRNDITAFRSETRAELNDVKHRLGRVEEQIVGLLRMSSVPKRIPIASKTVLTRSLRT